MPARQPTADQFRAFRDDPHDGPICQVNLLKFKVKAEYQPGDAGYGVDEPGRAAYHRYARAFAKAAADVGGRCLLLADAERYFIGNGDWDGVLIMQFPDRKAFIATLNHSDYPEMNRHREAGLMCQDLVVTHPLIVAGEDI
ncbi:MAG: DUF1330 domain-containing protein [Pseudomonadota bacterium]